MKKNIISRMISLRNKLATGILAISLGLFPATAPAQLIIPVDITAWDIHNGYTIGRPATAGNTSSDAGAWPHGPYGYRGDFVDDNGSRIELTASGGALYVGNYHGWVNAGPNSASVGSQSTLTFQNYGTTAYGGVIYVNQGTYTLEGVRSAVVIGWNAQYSVAFLGYIHSWMDFENNRATHGGAIYNHQGDLELLRVTFHGNAATGLTIAPGNPGFGGAVFNDANGTISFETDAQFTRDGYFSNDGTGADSWTLAQLKNHDGRGWSYYSVISTNPNTYEGSSGRGVVRFSDNVASLGGAIYNIGTISGMADFIGNGQLVVDEFIRQLNPLPLDTATDRWTLRSDWTPRQLDFSLSRAEKIAPSNVGDWVPRNLTLDYFMGVTLSPDLDLRNEQLRQMALAKQNSELWVLRAGADPNDHTNYYPNEILSDSSGAPVNWTLRVDPITDRLTYYITDYTHDGDALVPNPANWTGGGTSWTRTDLYVNNDSWVPNSDVWIPNRVNPDPDDASHWDRNPNNLGNWVSVLNPNPIPMLTASGGAIYNLGNLDDPSGYFIGNQAVNSGGAIFNDAGGVIGNIGGGQFGGGFAGVDSNLRGGARFIENKVTGEGGLGGAIFNEKGGVIDITAANFRGNTAIQGFGGAIFNLGELELNVAIFSQNVAVEGGAIYNDWEGKMVQAGVPESQLSQGGRADILITAVTFENNVATGGTVHGIDYEGHGGAIYTSLGTLQLDDATFITNVAAGDGGAIYSYMGSIDINRGSFTGNAATRGGAIYNYPEAQASLNSVHFQGNTAQTGGAIYNDKMGVVTLASAPATNGGGSGGSGGSGSSSGDDDDDDVPDASLARSFDLSVFDPNARLNSFMNNIATLDNGGAIFNTQDGKITLVGGVFTYNKAEQKGGAIYNELGGVIELTNVYFKYNTAGTGVVANTTPINLLGTGGYGGAIHNAKDGILTVNNAYFDFNAAEFGGAIYNAQDGVLEIVNKDKMSLTEGTFHRNTAIEGGAVYNDNNGKMTLDGVTFTFNSAHKGGAIYNEQGGEITLKDASFINNTTLEMPVGTTGLGGAIFNHGGTIHLSIETANEDFKNIFGADAIIGATVDVAGQSKKDDIYFAGLDNVFNVTVKDGLTLLQRGSMSSGPNSPTAEVDIKKDGGGTWRLEGKNRFHESVAGDEGKANFTVEAGTLVLAREAELNLGDTGTFTLGEATLILEVGRAFDPQPNPTTIVEQGSLLAAEKVVTGPGSEIIVDGGIDEDKKFVLMDRTAIPDPVLHGVIATDRFVVEGLTTITADDFDFRAGSVLDFEQVTLDGVPGSAGPFLNLIFTEDELQKAITVKSDVYVKEPTAGFGTDTYIVLLQTDGTFEEEFGDLYKDGAKEPPFDRLAPDKILGLSLRENDTQIVLTMIDPKDSATLYWTGIIDDAWNIHKAGTPGTKNWEGNVGGAAVDVFMDGDTVYFADVTRRGTPVASTNKAVRLTESVEVKKMEVTGTDYEFTLGGYSITAEQSVDFGTATILVGANQGAKIEAEAITFEAGGKLRFATAGANSGSTFLTLELTSATPGTINVANDILVDNMVLGNNDFLILIDAKSDEGLTLTRTGTLQRADGVPIVFTRTDTANRQAVLGIQVNEVDPTQSQLLLTNVWTDANSTDLTWSGAITGSVWDVNTTKNWAGTVGGHFVDTFLDGDTVRFANTYINKDGEEKDVLLKGVNVAAGGVKVAAMTVDKNATGYSFNLANGTITAQNKDGSVTDANKIDFGMAAIGNAGAGRTAAGTTISAGVINFDGGNDFYFNLLGVGNGDTMLTLDTSGNVTGKVTGTIGDGRIDANNVNLDLGDTVVLIVAATAEDGVLVKTGELWVNGAKADPFERSAAGGEFHVLDVNTAGTQLLLKKVDGGFNTDLVWTGETSNLWVHDDLTEENWIGAVGSEPVKTFLNGDRVTFIDDADIPKEVVISSDGVRVGEMTVESADYVFSLTVGGPAAITATKATGTGNIDLDGAALKVGGYAAGSGLGDRNLVVVAQGDLTWGERVIGGPNADFLSVSAEKVYNAVDDTNEIWVETSLTWYSKDPNKKAHGTFDFDSEDYPEGFEIGVILKNNENVDERRSDWNGTTLTKMGDGTLILTAENEYTGDTTIEEGTLRIENASGAGGNARDNSKVDIKGLGTFELAFGDPGDPCGLGNFVVYKKQITGAGDLVKSEDGIIVFEDNNPGFTGDTNITGGGIIIETAGALGTVGVVNVEEEATFTIGFGGTYAQEFSGDGKVYINPARNNEVTTILARDNGNFTGDTIICANSTAELRDINGLGLNTSNGTVELRPDATLNFNVVGSGTFDYARNFSSQNHGDGSIEKNNKDNTVRLTGESGGYSGTTTINAGTLIAAHADENDVIDALGTSAVTVNNTGVLGIEVAGTFNNEIDGAGDIRIDSVTGTVALTADNSGFTGTLYIDSGTARLENEHAAGANTQLGKAVEVDTGAWLALAFGDPVDPCEPNPQIGTKFEREIKGGGGVIIDAGVGNTVILTNSNSYYGETRIDSGSLIVENMKGLGNTPGVQLNGGNFTIGTGGELEKDWFTLEIHGNGNVYINPIRTGEQRAILTAAGSYKGDTIICLGSKAELRNIHAAGYNGTDTENQVVMRAGTTLEFNLTGSGTFYQSIVADPDTGGDGRVIKKGENSLTLAGANTYTNGTEIEAGGRLIANHSTHVGNGIYVVDALGTGTVTNYGTLVLNSGGPFKEVEFRNIVTGAGDLEVAVGGGNGVVLVGPNTYTGDTNITSGNALLRDLRGTGQNDASRRVNIGNGASLEIAVGGEYHKTITGAGTLVKSGADALTLTGANTHQNTDLKQGTTIVRNASALGQGQTTMGNAELQFGTANLTLQNSFNLLGSAVMNTNGFNATIDQTIIGGNAGSLTKTGTGTLTLAGNNTFSGLKVNNGRLTAMSQAALGNGPIDNNSELEINFASGVNQFLRHDVHSAGGTFIKSGAGRMNVDDTFATKAFQMSGGTLGVKLGAGLITATDGFLVDSGTIVGMYESAASLGRGSGNARSFEVLRGADVENFTNRLFESNLEHVEWSTHVSGNSLFYDLWTKSFVESYRPYLSDNAANAADGVDFLPEDDYLFRALNSLRTTDEVVQAFSELHGEIYQAAIFAQADMQRQFNDQVLRRRIYCGHAREFKSFRAQSRTKRTMDSIRSNRELWVQFTGGGTFRSQIGKYSAYDMGRFGVVTGIEHRLNQNLFGGIAFGYDQATLKLTQLPSRDRFDAFRLSIYGGYHSSNDVSTMGYFGYAKNWHNVERNIAFLAGTATGTYNDDVLTVGFDTAKTLHWNALRFIPSAGLHYVNVQSPYFEESGAGSASLFVKGNNYNSLRTPLGVRINSDLNIQRMRFTPELRMFYIGELAETRIKSRTAFAANPTHSFVVDSGVNGRSGFQIGVGLSAEILPRFTLGVDYDGEMWNGYTRHDVGASATLRW